MNNYIKKCALAYTKSYQGLHLLLWIGLSTTAIPANRLWILAQCGKHNKARANSLYYMLINLGAGISMPLELRYKYSLIFLLAGAILWS